VSLTSETTGVTSPSDKWIIIGAMQTGEKTCEQEIKGTIAHEIGHYVINLVYQNDGKPYYKKNCAKYKNIVYEVKQIKEQQKQLRSCLTKVGNFYDKDEKVVDEKIEEVITVVYNKKNYKTKVRHQELVVRPIHIYAQFDDSTNNVEIIEATYKILFDFLEFDVLPEIEKFCLQTRGKIQIFNDFIGTLYDLQNSKIKIQAKNNLMDLLNSNSALISTNVPKMLFLDIYMKLEKKYKKLLDVKNIFVTQQKLEYPIILEKINDILNKNSDINIFVDYMNGRGRSFQIKSGGETKLFFLTSKDNKNQNEELVNNIKQQGTNPADMVINYNWMDLTAESQKMLLQNKINFQNNSTFSLSELILNGKHQQQPVSTISENLKIIIDDQLLNLLVEKSEIKINPITLENIEDKKFRILFQTRNLNKKYEIIKTNAELETTVENNIKQFNKIEETEELTQQQMLEDVKDKKFVLISDKAGSGKSWILKNFTNKVREMFPNKWITYVDLKQFIGKFKAQDTELEFAAFMADNILKLNTNFEAEIFKKMYKNGKVCIIFDGFDEIAPDCAEFVTKLFQSFQQNGGNQLWIATRDYFEVDLKEKLKLDAVYKLDEFTEEHGVELIASSWILSEFMQEHKTLMETDTVKTSSNLQEYKIIVKNLIEKIPKTQYNLIGLPQFYKMVADITQNNKDITIDFTMFKIFEQCVQVQCERWSHEKGELRKNESTKSHEKELNYQKLHQLVAIKSLFPKDSMFCDLNIENLEQWTDQQIVACGMLTKIGEIFLFSHETFREYFVAKFILRILMKPGTRDDDQVCGYLIEILTVRKFEIIRMFLNEAFAEESTMMKIERKIPQLNEKFCENAEKLEYLSITFWENFVNLAEFLLKIIKNGNYDKMKDILYKNKNILSASTESKLLFTKVQDFVMNYFKGNDFKDFLSNNRIFLQIFESSLDIQTINEFLKASKEKTDSNFIKKSLRKKGEEKENLFFYLTYSDKFSSEFFQQVIQILKAYFNMNEINELIIECKYDGYNILHQYVRLKNARKLENLWNSLELLFKSENISKEFKKILSQNASGYGINIGNIFHSSTKCEEMEFHKIFWRLLLNTFESQEDLLDLIMQGDKDGNNYVHYLIIYSKPDIIEFSFEKIKEKFSSEKYEQILKSKGYCGRNLLHQAAFKSSDIKTHQTLWKIIRDFYKSDRGFLEFFKEVDGDGDNVLHIAACRASKEIFEFMMNQLEEIASNKEIRNILKILGYANRNLLQSAAVFNKSVEFHEYLWAIMRKYFSLEEVLDMINLFYAAERNTKQILELTWSEIKNVFNKTQNTSSIQQYLSCVKKNEENILHKLMISGDSEKLKYFWSELENYFTNQQLRELMSQKSLDYKQNVLHLTAYSIETEFHETLWELLVKTFENREDLKDLIMQGDKNEENYVHSLVKFNKSYVIEFNFQKLRKIFNDDQYEEILKSKEFLNRSLFESAARFNDSLEVHETLWKIYREYFNDSQMFDIIKHTDEFGKNIFTCAMENKDEEIVKIIWKEMREILTYAECFNQTLSDLLNKFEEYLEIPFKDSLDNDKIETIKLMWNKLIREFELRDSYKQMERILSKELSTKDVKSLHRLALCEKLEHHEALRQNLLESFENKEKLKDLILKKNFYENNFLHILVTKDNPDIIEFTLKTLKSHFSDKEFREILQTRGELGRNLLQITAKNGKNLKIHQILWKIFREFSKPDQEFLELIKEVDKTGRNVLHIAASASTAAIFDFMITSLEKVSEIGEIKNLLGTFGYCEENILHAATGRNKSLELHQKLWEVIQKYFSSSEILQMINYCDKDCDNIFHNAVYWNTKEIVEFTWNQIKKFIQTKEEQTEYLKVTGHYSHSLLQMSLENISKDPEVHTWVENLMTKYEIDFK